MPGPFRKTSPKVALPATLRSAAKRQRQRGPQGHRGWKGCLGAVRFRRMAAGEPADGQVEGGQRSKQGPGSPQREPRYLMERGIRQSPIQPSGRNDPAACSYRSRAGSL